MTAMFTQCTDGMAPKKTSLNRFCNLACGNITIPRANFSKTVKMKPQTSGPIIMRVTTVKQ